MVSLSASTAGLFAVDILPEIDGVDFDRAWEKRVEGVIDTATGLTAYFISDSGLLAPKIAAGRPQDIADVAALRKAAESRTKAAKGKQTPRQT